jgi:GTPase
VAANRERRIPTSQVNEVLRQLIERKNPPQFRGNAVRMQYASQVAVKPPGIVIFTNHPKGVPEHYMRYLHNGFRAAWGFMGTPLRLRLRAKHEEESDS